MFKTEKPKNKYSRQRERIFEVVKSTHLHPTADWIYEKLRSEIPNLSLGTVYRNLALLRDMGMIKELTFNDSSARFDGFVDDHQHFICEKCNKIYDIQIDMVPQLSKELQKKLNVEVKNIRAEFYGICEVCKSNN